jgi:dipeptidyl aminopeptidase/acylaminoacyl peptidase
MKTVNNLGQYEAESVIAAARELIQTSGYLDPKRAGVWGWSYGGYLTAKIIEANSDVFVGPLVFDSHDTDR